MLKFLLITFLFTYALFRIGRFLFKILTLGGSSSFHSKRQPHTRKPPGANVNVDYVPKKHRKPDFKGGDYVDFEEVK